MLRKIRMTYLVVGQVCKILLTCCLVINAIVPPSPLHIHAQNFKATQVSFVWDRQKDLGVKTRILQDQSKMAKKGCSLCNVIEKVMMQGIFYFASQENAQAKRQGATCTFWLHNNPRNLVKERAKQNFATEGLWKRYQACLYTSKTWQKAKLDGICERWRAKNG